MWQVLHRVKQLLLAPRFARQVEEVVHVPPVPVLRGDDKRGDKQVAVGGGSSGVLPGFHVFLLHAEFARAKFVVRVWGTAGNEGPVRHKKVIPLRSTSPPCSPFSSQRVFLPLGLKFLPFARRHPVLMPPPIRFVCQWLLTVAVR
jgi:hypothetical protein